MGPKLSEDEAYDTVQISRQWTGAVAALSPRPQLRLGMEKMRQMGHFLSQKEGISMRQLRARAAGWRALALVLAAVVCGCGASTDNASDSGPNDSSPNADAGPDGGQAVYILTVTNYLNWCSISREGDAGYLPTAAFLPGTVVPLDASPLPGYVWGYWTGTDGADGGHDLNMDTTVTMDASKQVVACCPQQGGAPTCPVPMP